MKRTVSVYLDFLRILAAVGVFLGHASFRWFSGNIELFPSLGHEFVVGFFFISGFVVAYATLEKGGSATDYVVARLSRLYSVVLPALVLTAVLRQVGTWINPEFYRGFECGYEWLRWISSACFVQELWFVSSSPPTNAPLWSLGYEFWYYVLFGSWIFSQGGRRLVVLVAVVVLIAGPKLLLLLPVWLLGLAGWWVCRHVVLNRWVALGGTCTSAMAAWHLVESEWCYPAGELAITPLYYSGRFLSDWVLGALVFLHVVCFSRVFPHDDFPKWLERPIRWGASKTFSLYVYHFPMLVFAAAVVPYEKESPLQVCAVVFAILVTILGLQRVTEQRRTWWQMRFSSLVSAITKVVSLRLKSSGLGI